MRRNFQYWEKLQYLILLNINSIIQLFRFCDKTLFFSLYFLKENNLFNKNFNFRQSFLIFFMIFKTHRPLRGSLVDRTSLWLGNENEIKQCVLVCGGRCDQLYISLRLKHLRIFSVGRVSVAFEHVVAVQLKTVCNKRALQVSLCQTQNIC